MRTLIDRIKDVCRLHPGWLALITALALTGIGIMAIGTSDAANNSDTTYAQKQTMWLAISVGVMLLMLLPHPRIISVTSWWLLGTVLLLLLVIVLPFMPRSIVPVINHTKAWINLGIMNFQPSEVAKLVFVLAIAHYLQFRENHRTIRGLMIPFVIMFVPVALVLKQPDLGTAILFVPALFAMLVAAGAKLRHMGTLAAMAVLAVALNVAAIYTLPDSVQLLRPHQRMRIKSMISLIQGDDKYVNNHAYQQAKTLVAVGSGRLTGYGAERSATIIRFVKVPENHNDMIFGVIVNRWGALGGLTVLLLFLALIISFLLAAAKSKDPFARLAICGFAGLLFAQVAINVGMNIGLLPIIGITLPFVSYGGSSLLATFAMVGLVMNFASRRPAIINRPSFEFGNPNPITT